MDHWILDNLEKLVPIVIALLYFLGSSKVKKMEEQRESSDPEAAERSRKIQEEIRRKILERQQQSKPVAVPAPEARPFEIEEETILLPWEVEEELEEFEPYPEPEYAAPPLGPQEDLFEQQQKKIDEQLKKARELKKIAASRTRKLGGTPMTMRRSNDLNKRLRKDLQETGSIRRAVALKELLDKPLALR